MAQAPAWPLTEATLARWPLPILSLETDKDSHGRVLVIAGSVELRGAALLAAIAALRAGAGKLTIAAPECIAPGLALAVPESRVIALAETPAGGFHASGCDVLAPIAGNVDAVVMGPGMLDEAHSVLFVREALPMFRRSTVVLDALAMSVVGEGPLTQPVILTPHAGEMAHLSGLPKEAISSTRWPQRARLRNWNALVALKRAVTHMAQPTAAHGVSAAETPASRPPARATHWSD